MSLKESKKSDWAALLRSALNEKQKLPPGKGWLTFDELREEWGCAKGRTYDLIQQLGDRLERFEGQRTLSTGKLARTVWYRPKG